MKWSTILKNKLEGEVSEVHYSCGWSPPEKPLNIEDIDRPQVRVLLPHEDISGLYEEVINKQSAPGEKIFHIIPQEYIIDDEPGISSPVGCTAKKVEAVYKLLSAPVSYQENIKTALDKINIDLENVVVSPHCNC